jgi:hypothetical protein
MRLLTEFVAQSGKLTRTILYPGDWAERAMIMSTAMEREVFVSNSRLGQAKIVQPAYPLD